MEGGTACPLVVWVALAVLLQTAQTNAQLLTAANSCSNLNAGNTPQNNANSPFFLQTSLQYYSTGSTITLTVQPTQPGLANRQFQEIICQAQTSTGQPVGTFTTAGTPASSQQIFQNTNYELYACTGSTVGTSNTNIKEAPITFGFTAPAVSTGNFQFECTIVVNAAVYYENLQSEVISPVSTLPGPDINNCPGDIRFPITTQQTQTFVFISWVLPTSVAGATASSQNPTNPNGFYMIGIDPQTETYSFTLNGVTSTCQFTIQVNDLTAVVNTAPSTPTCPGTVTVNAVAGAASAVATFTNPPCTDAQDGTFSSVCSPVSGSNFPLGPSTVTCTCTDTGQLTSQCTFVVIVTTVVNTAPSTPTCPGTVTVNAVAGAASAVAAFTNPPCTDAQDGTFNSVCSPVSGSNFPLGTSTVTCTCTDTGQLTSQCTFVVIASVVNTPPTLFNCPDPFTVTTAVGSSTATVTYNLPICVDAQDGTISTVTCTPSSGSNLGTGSNNVNCVCIDSGGLSDTCSFAVTVQTPVANTPPTLFNCPNPFTVTTAVGSSTATVTYNLPICVDAQDGTISTVTCTPSSGSNLGNGLNNINCVCTDSGGLSDTCSFAVTVQTPVVNTPPTLFNCPNPFTVTAAVGSSMATVTYNLPICVDAQDGTISTVTCTPSSGSNLGTGLNNINCVCTDSGGLSDTCSFAVTVQTPVVNTPPTLFNCPNPFTVTAAVGSSTATVTYTLPTCVDAQDGTISTVTCTPSSGSNLGAGLTNINCVCTDSGGLSDTCSFAVTVQTPVVNTPPILFNCPNPFTVTAVVGSSSAAVTYTIPTCVDAQDGTVSTVTCNPNSGSILGAGLTDVNCVCTDSGGLTDTCSFGVTVQTPVVNTPPTLFNCPNPFTVTAAVGSFSAAVTYTLPTCVDAQDGTVSTVTCNPSSGSILGAGLTNINCVCTDSGGLTDTCSFAVTVQTVNSPPQIGPCPDDIQIIPIGGGQVIPIFTLPPCTDVEDAAPVVSCTPAQGITIATFPGFLSCTCTDSVGATDTVSCAVNSPPSTPQCPADITVTSVFGSTGAAATFSAPFCTDNEEGFILSQCTPGPGSVFQLGSNAVVCTCTDAGNLQANCVFNVIVQAPVNTPPTLINCPNPFTVTAAVGSSTATVTYTLPTCVDAQDGTITTVTCTPSSGSTLGAGLTNINCVCTDSGGLSDTCSFGVTVQTVNSPPQIGPCPDDIQIIPIGGGQVIPIFTPPPCTDVEDAAPVVSCTPAQGITIDTFPGLLSCTCTDSVGATDTVSCAVNSPPSTPQCPADITVTSAFGSTGAPATFSAPFCTDTEEGAILSQCTPGPGSVFQLGSNAVVCTCTDAGNLQANCVFNVIVQAPVNTPPTLINCPNPFTVTAAVGSSTAIVTYTLPTCVDAQDGTISTFTCTPSSGSTLGAGLTNINCVCTDSGGLSDTCSFGVTVQTVNSPPQIGPCPDDIQIIPIGGGQVIPIFTPPPCTDVEDAAPVVSCTPAQGITIDTFPGLLSCTCTDSVGATDTVSCAVNSPPSTPQCPADITVTSAFGSTGAPATFSAPFCTDPEEGTILSQCTPGPGSVFQLGSNAVVCTCTDAGNLQANCVFNVIVQAPVNTPPTLINCPNPFTVTAAVGSSTAIVTYTLPTCVDAQDGTISTVTCTPSSGSTLGAGLTNINCVCTDSGGLTDTCSFAVTVQTVNSPPQIGPCPGDIQIIPIGGGQVIPIFTLPSCTDIEDVNPVVSCNPTQGIPISTLPGLLSCTCTDSSGATDTVDCTVNSPPSTPQCPADITVTSVFGSTGAPATFSAPFCTDNEEGVILSQCTPGPGSVFQLGSNAVVCTCTDAGNLQANCVFNVIVQAPVNTPPTLINCPNPFTVTAAVGSSTAIVTYTLPTCVDAQDGTISTVTCTPSSGSTLGAGLTNINCVCTDSGGLSDTCSFGVTVQTVNSPPQIGPCPGDIQIIPIGGGQVIPIFTLPSCTDIEDVNPIVSCNPTQGIPITTLPGLLSCTCTDSSGATDTVDCTVNSPPSTPQCPADITVTSAFGSTGAPATFSAPFCTDPEEGTILSQCTPGPGSVFQLGSNAVVCTCTDAGNLQANCVFNVIVQAPVNTPPTLINCPNPFTVTAAVGSSTAIVTYTLPTCVDAQDGTVSTVTCTPSSGSTLGAGLTNINCVCTDSGGLSDTCSFAVTVQTVNSPPQIGPCPEDVQIIPTGLGQVIPIYTLPFCTDIEDATPVVSCTPAQGVQIATLPGLLSCTCTDSAGATDTVTCTVNTPPATPQCPADITVTSVFGATGAAATFTPPPCTDSEQGGFLSVCTPGSGSTFQLGSNAVVCTCTDAGNLQSTCVFNVIIQAAVNTPPTLICPNSFSVTANIGSSTAVVTYTPPVCVDSEDGTITSAVTCTPSSGSSLGAGVNTVNCVCTDSGGLSDTCTFEVTVLTRFLPVLTCPQDITSVAAISNSVDIDYNPLFCTEPLAPQAPTTITCSPPEGLFNIGSQQPVTCTCIDQDGDTDTCSFTVTVLDVTPPVISNCPVDLQPFVIGFGQPGVFVTWTVPTATDNDGQVVNVVATGEPFFATTAGSNVVTYTFTDTSGNENICSFTYTVIQNADTEPPVITCPQSITVNSLPNQNGNTVTFPPPTCTDNSNAPTLESCNPMNNEFFAIGPAQTVTCTCVDAANLADTCTFQFTVVDRTPPVLTCPQSNLQFEIPFGQAGVLVTWTVPVPTDNDGLVPQLTSSENPNTFVTAPVTSVVTYTATDSSGNEATCSFVYVVTAVGDSVPPVITCPTTVNAIANPQPVTNPASAGANVFFNQATCTDNSGTFTVTCVPGPESFFGITTTQVTCTCIDGAGLADTCTFNVVVTDTTPPVVNGCPDSTVESVAVTQTGAVVTYTPPQGQDNSGVATLITTPEPPGFFPVGNTVVTYTYRDPAGLETSCVFTITVTAVDSEPPTIIVCPIDQTLTVLRGETGGIVNFPDPLAQDNSGFVFLANNPEYYPGFYFPLGITEVIYIFSDAVPLTATCSFNVIVNDASPCDSAPCENGGSCLAVDLGQFWCVCPNCFLGERCQVSQSACDTNNQCLNGGVCQPFPGSCTQTYCECPSCFTGATCQISVNPCDNNQCANGGVCIPDPVRCDSYSCLCTGCNAGQFCQLEFNPCSRGPCANNGICTNLAETCASYSCECQGCFTGYNCETPIPDPCALNPCLNGAACQRFPGTCFGYTCQCPSGFGGVLCDSAVLVLSNPCNNFPCANFGCCITLSGSDYKCICQDGYTGINCEEVTSNVIATSDSCLLNPCNNGATCYNSYNSNSGAVIFNPQYTCVCAPGFAGQGCNLPIASLPNFDTCTISGTVCLNGGVCRNTYCSFSSDLGTFCDCPVGFYGERCQIIDVNRCLSSPCRNGGQCTPLSKFFICQCLPGFSGTTCEIVGADTVNPIIANCPSQGIFVTANIGDDFGFVSWPDLIVTDDSGHVDLVSSNAAPGNYPIGSRNVIYIYEDAAGNPATCSFVITVNPAPNDPCAPNPCQNGAFCTVTGGTFQCQCVGGFTGPLCNQGVANPCAVNPCLNDGNCLVTGDTFFCQCVGQFTGQFCEQALETACFSAPCLNGGVCVDILNGNAFVCQCVNGFTGTTCGIPPTNVCSPVNPCQNGGTCIPSGSTFNCLCPDAFSGIICQTPTSVNTAPTLVNCNPVSVTAAAGSSTATVTYTPVCVDTQEGQITPTCTPVSGSVFGLGPTTVNCVCTDTGGLSDSCSFVVTVQTSANTAPTLVNCNPVSITAAAGSSTAAVTYTPVCVDTQDGQITPTCTPVSGSIFGLGQTTVNCVCSDTGGLSDTCSFVVTVQAPSANTAPTLVNCNPVSITAAAGSSTAAVTYTPVCVDTQDGQITPTCTPVSGSIFGLGQTTINCVCSDTGGLSDTCSFVVTVQAPSVNTPPTLVNCPNPFTVNAAVGSSTATVTYPLPTCVDAQDGQVDAVSCTPSSGSNFGLGPTTVTCVCVDSGGLSDTCSFVVTVQSVQQTFAQCGSIDAITLTAGSQAGTVVVSYNPLPVTCPTGQSATCSPQNGEAVTGSVTSDVDVCCRCSTGGTVISTCCVPRSFSPTDTNFLVTSENFGNPYPANRVMNAVVTTTGTSNIQTRLQYFTTQSTEVLQIGSGSVIKRPGTLLQTYSNVAFAAINDDELVTSINSGTVWICFESNAQTINNGEGYVIRIEEDTGSSARKRRSIAGPKNETTQTEWEYNDEVMTNLWKIDETS